MDNSLQHYGILGMHWGKHKAAASQRRIERANFRQKQNKDIYNFMKKESHEAYDGKNPKKLAKSLASDKALFDTTTVANQYKIAKNKAKINPEYKNSEEYKKIKTSAMKQKGQLKIYGTYGHQRIETLKNLGVSEKKAKASTFIQETLAGIAIGGAYLTATYLAKK